MLTPTETVPKGFPSPAEEVARLRTGAQVVHLSPDESARPAVGRSVRHMLDPARRATAAEGGRDQAARVVHDVLAVWT